MTEENKQIRKNEFIAIVNNCILLIQAKQIKGEENGR